jgi:hypothetical protein
LVDMHDSQWRQNFKISRQKKLCVRVNAHQPPASTHIEAQREIRTVRQPTVKNHRKTNTENILSRYIVTILAVGRFALLHSKSSALKYYRNNLSYTHTLWRSTDSPSSLISLLEIKRPLTPNPVASL